MEELMKLNLKKYFYERSGESIIYDLPDYI